MFEGVRKEYGEIFKRQSKAASSRSEWYGKLQGIADEVAMVQDGRTLLERDENEWRGKLNEADSFLSYRVTVSDAAQTLDWARDRAEMQRGIVQRAADRAARAEDDWLLRERLMEDLREFWLSQGHCEQ